MLPSKNTIYVIGHINPDADAICSAMGYAWLLQHENPDVTVVAARAGQLNPAAGGCWRRGAQSRPSVSRPAVIAPNRAPALSVVLILGSLMGYLRSRAAPLQRRFGLCQRAQLGGRARYAK